MKQLLFAVCCALFFSACSGSKNLTDDKTWAFQTFEKLDDYNPILEPERGPEFFCPMRKKNVRWEEKTVFNPTAVSKDGRVWLLYRAQDKIGETGGLFTSRIGIANSRDGMEFKKTPFPVLFPAKDKLKDYEWEGGCEDPRVVKREDGKYVMLYTAYDGKVARLAVASSYDLMSWEKHGLAFPDKKYKDKWSKSGAVVCEKVNGEIVARKIKGKYWMYWGDTNIFMATSDDLIEWKPVEDKKKKELAIAMMPRPGFFDSRLVEPGPFALLTDKGILLLYNASNDAAVGDQKLPDRAYAVGQALFDAEKPGQMLARAGRHFMHPEKSYETNGQVNNVCFLEGMVWHKDRWLLYYGTADTKIAVATCK